MCFGVEKGRARRSYWGHQQPLPEQAVFTSRLLLTYIDISSAQAYSDRGLSFNHERSQLQHPKCKQGIRGHHHRPLRPTSA